MRVLITRLSYLTPSATLWVISQRRSSMHKYSKHIKVLNFLNYQRFSNHALNQIARCLTSTLISSFINFEVLLIMITILCIRYPHVRMNHQENKRSRALVRVWRKKSLVHCSWECKRVLPLWRTILSFLKQNYYMIRKSHIWVYTHITHIHI